jgi:hypothetical protein
MSMPAWYLSNESWSYSADRSIASISGEVQLVVTPSLGVMVAS